MLNLFQFSKKILSLLFFINVSGCASHTVLPTPINATSLKQAAEQGVKYLRQRNYREAHLVFESGLRQSPSNCSLHFLNGLTYHFQGKGGNLAMLNEANAGYQQAIHFCPNDAWSHYFQGLLFLDMKKNSDAEIAFSFAYKNAQYHKPLFLRSYIAAAYNNSDYKTVNFLLPILEKLTGETKFTTSIKENLTTIKKYSPQLLETTKPNTTNITAPTEKKTPQQATIDAVIILTDDIDHKVAGQNLLNGLKLEYRGNYDILNSRFSTHYLNITNSALKYNLNIFNTDTSHSEILAKPSLTVRDNVEAKYFSGRKLILGLTGSYASSLEQFPIGIEMTIKPKMIDANTIDLDISIARDDQTTATSLTTFKEIAEEISESVHTHIRLKYGETAILGSLSDNSKTSGHNRVPIIGRIPIVGSFFSKKESSHENTSLLFLITPKRYKRFYQPNEDQYSSSIKSFHNNYISPKTNMEQIINHLKENSLLQPEDLITKDMYSEKVMLDAASEHVKSMKQVY